MKTLAAAALLVGGCASVAAALLVGGCGARPAEPVPAIPATSHAPADQVWRPGTGAREFVRAVRPDVAIAEPRPDLGEEPRWPLTMMQHPVLEPGFNVASALADPGISWTDLCARGAHHRHDPARMDELAYLAGWCAAEQHEIRAAVAALAPLRNSAVPGISNAVAFDLANVLVGSFDEEHAEQVLRDEQVRDPHVWDLLAAAYFEIGKNEDAFRATSTAMQLDSRSAPATRCHRLARMILLGPEGARSPLREQLHGMNIDARRSDPVCTYLDAALPCALDNECATYYANQGTSASERLLAVLYDRWNEHRDSSRWIDYAWQLRRLSADPRANTLLRAALDAAVGSSACGAQPMHAIVTATDAMAASSTLPAMRDKAHWVGELASDQQACRDFVRQWLTANPQ